MTRLREPKKQLLLIRRLHANVATLLEQRRSTSLSFSDQTIDDSLRSPERNSTHIARESSVNTRPPYEPRCASRERDSGVLLSGRRRRASHTPRQLLSSPHPPLRCRSETMAGKVRPASKFATKVSSKQSRATASSLVADETKVKRLELNSTVES